MRIEREHACDDQVLRLGAKPEEYATHLVEIARGLAPKPQFSCAVGWIDERSQLEDRLMSILDPQVSRRSLSRLSTATLLCSISSIAVTLAVVRPAVTAPLPSAPRVMAASLEIIEKPAGAQTGQSVLTPPQLIAFSQPPYTPEAFKNYVEGTVTLETTVDIEGNVTASRVVKGLGYGLDESALDAVPSWKFSPALKNGSPVEASMQLSVEFKLADAAIRLAPGIAPPKIVSRVEPQLTEEARAARAKGTVVLEAVIRLDGTVEISRVIQPLGYGLTENAIHALKQWTFEPGTKDGERLPISMNISVIFDWR
jgi:TonB family protein